VSRAPFSKAHAAAPSFRGCGYFLIAIPRKTEGEINKSED
jgi:hypothetical protein